jgi:hypothetical protein
MSLILLFMPSFCGIGSHSCFGSSYALGADVERCLSSMLPNFALRGTIKCASVDLVNIISCASVHISFM